MPQCGGDLTGTWDVVVSSCQDQTYTPPMQITLDEQLVDFAREVTPERTGTDWCGQLVLRNGEVEAVRLEQQTVPVSSGSMTYAVDGGYQGALRFVGTFSQFFSRACLTAHGDNPTCAQFDAALKARTLSSSGLSDVACSDAQDGGCDCSYTLAQDGAFTGQWSTNGGVLTHFDAFLRLPNEVDYCVRDNQLEMLGHQRSFLWDRVGLRGLVWARSAP